MSAITNCSCIDVTLTLNINSVHYATLQRRALEEMDIIALVVSPYFCMFQSSRHLSREHLAKHTVVWHRVALAYVNMTERKLLIFTVA